MEDFDSYFNSLNKFEEEKQASSSSGSSREQKHLLLTRKSNTGTIIFRPIADTETLPDGTAIHKPLRIITGVYEFSTLVAAKDENGEEIKNDDGTTRMYTTKYRIVEPENYITPLSPSDAQLLNETIKAINDYQQACTDNNLDPYNDVGTWFNYRKQVTLLWAKVFSFESNCGTDVNSIVDSLNKVFLIRSHSPRFTTAFNTASNDKTRLKGSSQWRNQLFSRTVGTNDFVCSITTTLNAGGTIGFNFNIQFEEIKPYELTQQDIDKCTDLNAEWSDVTKFDPEIHKFVRDTCKEAINKIYKSNHAMDGLTESTAEKPSTPVIQNSEVPKVNPTAQNTAGSVTPTKSTVTMMPPRFL